MHLVAAFLDLFSGSSADTYTAHTAGTEYIYNLFALPRTNQNNSGGRKKKHRTELLSMSERPTLKRGTSTSGSAYASSSGYTAFQQQPQQPQQHSSYYPTQRPPSFLYPDNQSYDPTASSRALVYRSPPYGHGQYYSAAPTESSYLPRSSNSAYNHTPSWFASSSSQQLPFSLSGTDSKDPSNPYYADPDASRLGSETGKGYSYSGLGAVVKMYERSPQ